MFQVKQSSPLGVSGVSCVARLQRDRVAVKSVHTCRRAAGDGLKHSLVPPVRAMAFSITHSIAMHWKSLNIPMMPMIFQ